MKRVLSNLNPTKKTSMSSATTNSDDQIPPKVEVDARLPDPAILTSNYKLPLRLLIKRLDEGSLPLYLQTLQVELVGSTKVRAGQITRTESSSWVVSSRSNLNQYLEFPEPERSLDGGGNDGVAQADLKPAAGKETSEASIAAPLTTQISSNEKTDLNEAAKAASRLIWLDPTPWEQQIPQTVAPTFKICNIERSYALEVRIGIGYGAQSAKNQIVLPLRLTCEVWSGISPPKSLVAAMESRPDLPPNKPVMKKPLSAQAAANVANYQAQAQASVQPSPSNVQYAPLPVGEEEPPPSYEDAMADNIGPVDGPRNYQPPPAPAGGDGFIRNENEKRRDS